MLIFLIFNGYDPPVLLIYGVLGVRWLKWPPESLLGASSTKRYLFCLLSTFCFIFCSFLCWIDSAILLGCCPLLYRNNKVSSTNSWASFCWGKRFFAEMLTKVCHLMLSFSSCALNSSLRFSLVKIIMLH